MKNQTNKEKRMSVHDHHHRHHHCHQRQHWSIHPPMLNAPAGCGGDGGRWGWVQCKKWGSAGADPHQACNNYNSIATCAVFTKLARCQHACMCICVPSAVCRAAVSTTSRSTSSAYNASSRCTSMRASKNPDGKGGKNRRKEPPAACGRCAQSPGRSHLGQQEVEIRAWWQFDGSRPLPRRVGLLPFWWSA